ncbi:GntR family transcriptional regulator / MocR family aminotransferase [Pseudonocardia thermophila]|uniref:GntR family transcriptional regulator / MocR family aminotransferase n=1 Tax=Pseudonocardia thermophila TaxID=1848 RepID=A0A1M7AJF3_PSETH|nr:PLP-dependent aminotransferase family protein [Pseudonocardia thermophila]SHL42529.1 GntR family transcriptional regulator / MocR family aminotransferase [Pseudonocardia thermophila]
MTPRRNARPAGTPAYLVLYERLRAGILSGQLAAGSRLPPSRALAAETGLSRNTVLAALAQLEAEGYIVGRRGSGTYVASVLPEHMLTAGTRLRVPARPGTGAATLSERGQRLTQIRRMPLPAVIGREPKGTAFLIGLPALDRFPFETWTRLHTERLRRSAARLMTYDDPAGYRPLREAIAAHVGTSRGIRCSADQVVVTSGSQQALELCARILLDPGDAAWLEDPGYLGARAALVSAGARLVPVPVDEEGLDVAAGIAREPDARLAVVTPSYQFPLGHTMSLPRRIALIEWAGSRNAWIVEDDYDAEFHYVGRPHAALAAIDAHQRVVYVGTFSKVLFPGLRLGYLVAPPHLVDGFVAARLSTDIHASLFDQAVVADFMTAGHLTRHLRRMRVLHRERQQELLRLAEPLVGALDLAPSNGGLHLIGRLHPSRDDRAIARRAVQDGVHVWPLSTHYLGAEPRPALLLGYAGTTPEDMRAGIRVLERALG